ncbi:MAG: 30S ribosomal protein S20 [Thermoguttaceae bacterium]
MPHSRSAKKRHRQSLERRDRNRAVKRELKTRVRKVVEAVDAGKAEEAQGALRVAAQKLDRAATHKIIHCNAAARTKSRLAARIKTLKTAVPAT